MDLHEFRNVRRTYRIIAAQWGCPVWMVKRIIQKSIDDSWETALSDPQAKALWDTYFPSGKPTPTQYILRLGRAQETGEEVPFLFNE